MEDCGHGLIAEPNKLLQRMLLYCLNGEDWQTHHVKLYTYMQHQHNIREIPMWTDKIIREIGGHFYTTLPWEMHHPHKQFSENTIKETLMGQSSPFHCGERKVEESHAACDVTDTCKFSGKIKTQKAAHKPYIASMPSKTHEAGRMRLGWNIWKPHRLGIDAWTD